jgi:hypothetical protein
MPFPKPVRKPKKKKGLNRVRKTPVGKLKKIADSLMSKWIIARDKKCITCGTTTGLTNSHLITRGKNSVRWDSVNCNCQCFSCNLRHEYYPEYYTKWFIKNYGQLMYEDLVDRSQVLVKVNRAHLERVIELYS